MAERVKEVEDRRLLKTYQKLGLVVERGEGVYVFDVDGRRYLDLMAGYGVAILGHSNRAIVDEIKRQSEKLITCHGSLYTPSRARFLEELFASLPSHLEAAYLANSGAEAVEAAIKISIKATGRRLLVAAKGGYHGKTLGALSVTFSEKYRRSFNDVLIKTHFVEYGEVSSVKEAPFEEAAAVVVEPIQGESGVRIPTREFMQALENRCRSAGCVLVVDEIQSGLGRTGRMWGFEHWGIKPDVVTIGKGIAGGVPMGVTVVSSELKNVLGLGEHTSTFGGNPLATAVASVVLRTIREERLYERARTLGGYMLRLLEGLTKENRLAVRARGLGLMAALDTRVRVSRLLPLLASKGLLVLYSGLSTIRFLPPLIVEDAHISHAVSIIEETLNELLNRPG